MLSFEKKKGGGGLVVDGILKGVKERKMEKDVFVGFLGDWGRRAWWVVPVVMGLFYFILGARM